MQHASAGPGPGVADISGRNLPESQVSLPSKLPPQTQTQPQPQQALSQPQAQKLSQLQDSNDDDNDTLILEDASLRDLPAPVMDALIGNGRLRKLSLKNNLLAALPPIFGTLQSLYYVNISNNRLEELPLTLCDCLPLEILDVSNNSIRRLPPDLARLKNLKVLSLSGNNIRFLSPVLADLPNLVHLEVDNNPIMLPPPELLAPAVEADDDGWIARLQGYLSSHRSELELADARLMGRKSSVNVPPAADDEARHLERARSASESGLSLRQARRMGFVMEKNASGSSYVASLHARGMSHDAAMLSGDSKSASPAHISPHISHPSPNPSSYSSHGQNPVPHGPSGPNHHGPHTPAYAFPPVYQGTPATPGAAEPMTPVLTPVMVADSYASPISSPPRVDKEPLPTPVPQAPPNQAISAPSANMGPPKAPQSIVTKATPKPPVMTPTIDQQRSLLLSKLDPLKEEEDDENDESPLRGVQDLSASPKTGSILASAANSATEPVSALPAAPAVKRATDKTTYALRTLVNAGTDIFGNLPVESYPKLRELWQQTATQVLAVVDRRGGVGSALAAVADLMEAASTVDFLAYAASRLPRRSVRAFVGTAMAALAELQSAYIDTLNPDSLTNEASQADDELLYAQLEESTKAAQTVLSLVNSALARSAHATAQDQDQSQTQNQTGQSQNQAQETPNLAVRTRELSNTCIPAVASTRKVRNLLESRSSDKRRVWDDVNMFVKSIVAMLGAIKSAMPDIPLLADASVGAAVASLARNTKEIPPLLEQSSFRHMHHPSSHGHGPQTPTLASISAASTGPVPTPPSAPTPLTATLGSAVASVLSPDIQAPTQSPFFD